MYQVHALAQRGEAGHLGRVSIFLLGQGQLESVLISEESSEIEITLRGQLETAFLFGGL